MTIRSDILSMYRRRQAEEKSANAGTSGEGKSHAGAQGGRTVAENKTPARL